MTPNAAFKYLTADQVAECWEGVPEPLYLALWNKVVPFQSLPPNIEDSGPFDHVGHENLASHWHRLAPEEQSQLNALAEARARDDLLDKRRESSR